MNLMALPSGEPVLGGFLIFPEPDSTVVSGRTRK